MIKLIISDLDGTLLNDQKKLSQRTLNAIDKAKQQGIKICMASGRFDAMMSIYSEAIQGCDYLLSCNGSMVKNEQTKEVLFSACILDQDVKEILRYFKEKQCMFMMYSYDTIYYSAHPSMLKRITDYEELASKTGYPCKLKAQQVDLNKENHFEHIIKMVAYEEGDEAIHQLRAFVDGLSACYTDSTGYGIYGIFNQLVSKKNGIDAIKKELNLADNEVVIFGDWDNDLSMFESGGNCVAMANASDALKAKATRFTLTNNEDGVAIVIEEILKNNLEFR